MHLSRATSRVASRGFSLVEFMIAITLSLIVLVALTAMFISNMRAREELERAAQQIENGRYASQILTEELQMAGYYEAFDVFRAFSLLPAVTAMGGTRFAPCQLRGGFSW